MGGKSISFRSWKLHFRRHHAETETAASPPPEFVCPISKTLMSDPTIVASGHTFERVCARVCIDLKFSPALNDGTVPDFSSLIPNLALKTAIFNWCKKSGSDRPNPPLYSDIESSLRSLMAEHKEKSPKVSVLDSQLSKASDFNCSNTSSSSSEESVIANTTPYLMPYENRPRCLSYTSSPSTSSELISDEHLASSLSNSTSSEDDSFVMKLKSPDIYEQEQGVISLRKITKTNEDSRKTLCTDRVLFSLKTLLQSRYDVVQTNAVAALVNLSLEDCNKVKIVRSGIVPLLIDVLKNGFKESKEHASGALFSLALEDSIKTAIGVLGALEPLLRELRVGSQRSRQDSALALYHLTTVRSNRLKIIKLGGVGILLGLLGDADVAGRLVLVVSNLASCDEGRVALMDSDAIPKLVGVLRDGLGLVSEAIGDNCVASLYLLSQGSSLRFRGLAIEAGAVEVLRVVAEKGNDRTREKAKKVLEGLGASDEVEEGADEVDWEAVMKCGVAAQARHRFGKSHGG